MATKKKSKKYVEAGAVADPEPRAVADAAASPARVADAGDSNKIRDFISGQLVRATPEEVEAVQVFARRLVEDFGYPKKLIRTRPQHRVRPSPSAASSGAKSYPIDIAVFTDARATEEDLFIVVECKRENRTDGRKQLELYLTMSAARVGVWFNGNEHVYLLKEVGRAGVKFVELPTIPRHGQDIADIGMLTRRQLQPAGNLKAVFRDIRNHLAGNTPGVTRDQALAQEIMALLFCKIFDELDTKPDDLPRFRTRTDEAASKVASRVRSLFDNVKADYPDVFEPDEKISLDESSIQYIVGELQNYLVTGASRDAIGDAFEVFIGPATRGEEGQFFTPRNVVQLVVDLLDPRPGELLIDPACGSGGFLVVALQHMWSYLEREAKQKNWRERDLEKKKVAVATNCVRGIDKDRFLTKVTKAYMALIGDGRGGIFCQDSLEERTHWSDGARDKVNLGRFDIVITNPPFGSKIKVTGAQKLRQYDLARKWKAPAGRRKPKATESPKSSAKAAASAAASVDWTATDKFQKDQAPQILFIERCLQLLKPGGRLGIILPESIFGMSNYGYVVQFLLERCTVRAFVSLPEEVFQPYTHAKTCVVIAENREPPADYEIEMAIADWCGHDSRGNPTLRVDASGKEVLLDDVPLIAERMKPHLEWDRA